MIERRAARRSTRGKRLHTEDDRGLEAGILVGSYTLDLRTRQGLGPDPCDAAGMFLTRVPGRGGVAANSVFANAAIMQVGDPQVEIVRSVAGKVHTRTESVGANQLDLSLKHEANVRIEPVHDGAAVDEKHCECADLFLAVRRGEGERSRVAFEHEPAAHPLRRRTLRDNNLGTTTIHDFQAHRLLLWNPHPID